MVALAIGCHDSPTCQTVWFTEISAKTKLKFVHDAGVLGQYPFQQIVGSGGAMFDFDNDGRLDVLLLQNAGTNSLSTHRLFHQEPDGTFRDVSAGSGLDFASHAMGAAIGDINNDGWPDVLVTSFEGARLFLNNHNGTFTDITKSAGLDDPLWAVSAAFFDYDRDGWLDLVIVNYIALDPFHACFDHAGKLDYCGPSSFPGASTKLYHNLGGATVRFEDVTEKSGLSTIPVAGLGVVCADFDGDGWPDIFVSNDAQPNRLWINRHDGSFKEEGLQRGLAYNANGVAQGNMGIGLGDVDGDGLFDIFVTHLKEETNVLWSQRPRGLFQDRTAAAGLTGIGWHGTGFGTVFADFDNDGAVDLAVVNGNVKRPEVAEVDRQTIAALGPHWSAYAERNQLFANDGTGRFRDISTDNAPFCGTAGVYRGLICGDIDNDGALDLLVTAVAGPVRLYRNIAPKRGHWLIVRAVDPALGGRDAYGAEIRVEAGGRRFTRWCNPAYSYACSNDPRAHFGLGAAVSVDAIEVLWPDGMKETFPAMAVDRVVVLRHGDGTAVK